MLRTFDKMHEDCGSCVYWGERGHWLVAAGQSRDSDALERSNFECIRRAVDEIDPDCWAVESESHWAVGWVEHLLIDPACEAAVAEVERIRDGLEDPNAPRGVGQTIGNGRTDAAPRPTGRAAVSVRHRTPLGDSHT